MVRVKCQAFSVWESRRLILKYQRRIMMSQMTIPKPSWKKMPLIPGVRSLHVIIAFLWMWWEKWRIHGKCCWKWHPNWGSWRPCDSLWGHHSPQEVEGSDLSTNRKIPRYNLRHKPSRNYRDIHRGVQFSQCGVNIKTSNIFATTISRQDHFNLTHKANSPTNHQQISGR